MSNMHSDGFGWVNGGLVAQGGASVSIQANWGPFPQDRYIWGVQGDLYTSLAIVPTAGLMDYVKAIADMGVTVLNATTGEILLQKGVDHYDNAPTLNDHPHFFPRPFFLPAGQSLRANAHAENAYQKTYGGSFGFNTNVIVFFTYEGP